MKTLKEGKCEVCRAGAPQVSPELMRSLMPQIPEWEILNEKGINKLRRIFQFKNFAEALAFTNQVGALAEEEGHHPIILTTWGRVKVVWYTHKIKGLHLNDFIMASRTDELHTED